MIKFLIPLLLIFATANATTPVNGVFDKIQSGDRTKTWTMPNATGTVSCIACTETLSNKTFVAPALGTPVSGVATNLTGTATGLTCGFANNAITLSLSSENNNANYFLIFGNSNASTNQAISTGPATYNPSTGTITATTFAGAVSGNAATASVGTQVTATATSTNASFYLPFTSAATTGNYGLGLDSGLSYNPSTHALTTTTFVGAFTGVASGNLAATANNHGILVSGSGNTATVIAPNASTTKILTSGGSSADPSWQDPPVSTTLTTKGDLQTFTTVNARHAVPANYGRMVPDSGATDGWRNDSYTQIQNGRPGKNYVQYANLENNATTGWSATGCATITNGLPACNSGNAGVGFSSVNGGRAVGANTSAPAIDSSSAIGGTYSLNLATTGAGTIGDGYISDPLTIDKGDQAKAISFRFYYKVASGTPVLSGTSANTYAVAIYDVANAVWLPSWGNFNLTQSTGVGVATGGFQTSSNMTSFQVFIYSPVAPTGASSLLLDDFYSGPQTAVNGPVMTDSIAFTPTGTWSTNTTWVGYYQRDGENAHIKVQASLSGAPTGSFTLNMPTGLVIDTNKITSSLQFHQVVGTAKAVAAATTNYTGAVYFNTTTSVAVVSSSAANVWSATVPATFASGDYVTIDFWVPVVGWSSNSNQSSDTDTRVISAVMTGGSQSVTANTKITGYTATYDTAGAISASAFTCPVTGYYNVVINGINRASGSGNTFGLYQNGSQVASLFSFNGATGSNNNWGGSAQIKCNTGDVLDLRVDGTITIGIGTASFTRVSGPAVITATESVNMKYANTAGTSIANSGDVNVPFATKVYDSHGAFSGTIYTVPVSGKYRVSGTVIFASSLYAVGNNLVASVYKNGAIESYGPAFPVEAVVTTNLSAIVTTTVSCNAGDTLEVRVQNTRGAGATLLATSTGDNHIEIERVGN